MSAPSPEELVNTVANSLYQDTVNLVVNSGAWGFYVLLFIIATYLQCSNGLNSISKRLMFGLTCLLFCSSTTLWALNLVYFRASNAFLFGPLDPQSMTERAIETTSKQSSLAAPLEALYLLNMLVGDTLVIWRAYIICERSKLAILLPSLSLILSLGFAVGSIVCLETAGTTTATSISDGSQACRWAEPTAWGLSLFSNVVSTLAIALRVWSIRGVVKKALGYYPASSRAQRILMIIIESGLIYCAFWACEIVLFIKIRRASRAIYLFEVFTALRYHVSGIYSTAIIVIVNLQQTFVETTAIGSKIEFSSKAPAQVGYSQSQAINTTSIHQLRHREKEEEHSIHSENGKTMIDSIEEV
ncbi:hypothetical protein VKT23_012008 [Stygiomarasmius scandens]|uniref:Uncharacterized protein n=1 Tax=Marasmiellus scandens TaxID=2682957 RepID=A0ABR1J7J8_9AGAR